MPEAVKIENPFFRFEQVFERRDERTILCRVTFSHLAKRVPVEAYPAFKADVDRVEQCRNQRLFLTTAVPTGGKR